MTERRQHQMSDKKNTSALLPVAMATLFQSGCFLGVGILRPTLTFLPKDPVTLIGLVYGLAAVDMFVYFYYKNGRNNKQE
ncbi:hypothetical protein MAR_013100 [Mya arenaria]|uniref:Uncharacterized protein n=1 Tax=Mya arenaria TaxID=6604 RepID=A0ABY7G301_MYAAR|nr:hypothetical protein MAR_013100 [Mya arenaria]